MHLVDVGAFAHQRRQVQRHRRFAHHVVASELQSGGDHRFHFVQVDQHLLPLFFIIDEFGAQFEARDRRAQIVRNRRQHVRAIVHEGLQAALHQIERLGRALHFTRPAFRQWLGIEIKA